MHLKYQAPPINTLILVKKINTFHKYIQWRTMQASLTNNIFFNGEPSTSHLTMYNMTLLWHVIKS